MRFASLGSGSRGNGTLVESNNTCLLIDCGFTIKDTERRLARLGRRVDELNGILVTHEHSDHIKGVGPLARKYNLPVFASHGTALYEGLGNVAVLNEVNTHGTFTVGDIEVSAVAVPHDAREPCQYVFAHRDRRLGLLTDLGSITPFVVEQYRQCDALVLEFNHDIDMLAMGPYPPSLKRRVGGDWGHLNNRQAAQLLSMVEQARLQHVVMAHISEKNNTVALAEAALQTVLERSEAAISADQDGGFDWLAIA
ncbi:phosphoribosyl 1,2-cyclic phosphodiesterase [Litorivivens lipolytica]|uniref:Phosphoribosyl 1,2-cyclic phosphodiesterase n=1 Tax=Litorivivens lipolytica TaxID=1524264 RepID=A0A7W4Z6C4_9GAMM|nr:MBL fold metallo-hydrolase [Litorivivens lipolytica]MBB3048062.1 phosphoribosyl 1,2-cyclic phosphodiesterase [Litorivivens lipolytica]